MRKRNLDSVYSCFLTITYILQINENRMFLLLFFILKCFIKNLLYSYLETSLGKKDSAFSSTSDTNEYQRQIHDKERLIQKLNNELNERSKQIEELANKLTE